MNSRITVDLGRYQKLRDELKAAKNARVRVGILGSRAERQDDNWNKLAQNNPTIGLEHEFGVKRNKWGHENPARSWLRMPLFTHLEKEIGNIGKNVWASLVLKTSYVDTLRKLGVVAEAIIQQAFATGGFGTWAKLSAITIRRKKSDAILIETAQLRKSVSSDVHMGRGSK